MQKKEEEEEEEDNSLLSVFMFLMNRAGLHVNSVLGIYVKAPDLTVLSLKDNILPVFFC